MMKTSIHPRSISETYHRHYRIGGMGIELVADLPITDATFRSKIRLFETSGKEKGIVLRHHFSLPPIEPDTWGETVFRLSPWIVCRREEGWTFVVTGTHPLPETKALCPQDIVQLVRVTPRYEEARIHHPGVRQFQMGGISSLSLLPSDQVLLAPALMERDACIFHACGADLSGKGLLFVGHSGAGKSTLAGMLLQHAKVLCDDRIVVRRNKDGFDIHGTWFHGDVESVSPDSAPLSSVLFLQQANENRVVPVVDIQERLRLLLACLIRPVATAEWYEKALPFVGALAGGAVAYRLYFDRTGRCADMLKELVA